MKRIKLVFQTVGFGLCGVATTAFSRVVFAQTPPQINGNWLVDLRTVFAVGGVVLGGTAFIIRWMSRIEARLEAGDKWMKAIDEKLSGLPCTDNGNPCQDEHGKKKRTSI